jgi:hypothetical protein
MRPAGGRSYNSQSNAAVGGRRMSIIGRTDLCCRVREESSCQLGAVRTWGHSGQLSARALNGLSSNDPKATFSN